MQLIFLEVRGNWSNFFVVVIQKNCLVLHMCVKIEMIFVEWENGIDRYMCIAYWINICCTFLKIIF